MGDDLEQDLVRDHVRAPQPGAAPVPGAQWDELHGRWEVWDERDQRWLAVDPITGERSVPDDEPPMPLPLLVPELVHTEEPDPDEDDVVIDIDRLAAPPDPVPGAQWNEVVGRWEVWDDSAGTWVDALADA